MHMMEFSTKYFEKAGEHNTDTTLQLAVETAKKRNINTIVIASRTGKTAMNLVHRIQGQNIRVVVITPQFGWHDTHEFNLALIPQLRDQGHSFHTGSMPFHMGKLHGGGEAEAMANALRIFGHGTQVCVEIALMAVDGGHIKTGEKCICIAGTRKGADTAIVATPSSTLRFKDFMVHEHICRPVSKV